MRDARPIFTRSRAVEDMQHMRLMALLGELVRDKGVMKAAKALDVDHRTLTGSLERARLSKRMRLALERALLEGGGTPAAEQRARNDKLEARLDKLQAQQKELRDELRTGLKRLGMSLDGVRKYYAWQRRLIEQRLSALEAGRDGFETEAPARDGNEGPGSSSVEPSAASPKTLSAPTPAGFEDVEEQVSGSGVGQTAQFTRNARGDGSGVLDSDSMRGH